ncbi:choice-of-anchor J domain-containing protein [Flavobacterium sp.]|uniref:choice-of-anchor J domain-containing protein n=1 Tax=Flavobacterium sp. TaxID=239 RepID=UPI003527F4B9
MKKVLKTIAAFAVILSITTSCVNDDDFAIPTVYNYTFNESFSSIEIGSGSNEVAIAIDGWTNVNFDNPARVWHGRSYSNDNYAEFSSYYSNTGTTDNAWLITPAISLSSNEFLSFTTKYRYSNGDPVKVFISTNFDGNPASITTADWTELEFTLPSEDDVVTESGAIDLNSFANNTVYLAFEYTGSKSGITTTCQIDNIKIIKN